MFSLVFFLSRFRSAKEAEELEKKAEAKGEKLPKEARFDSNCITPGTVFMARLHDQLKYFVSSKISTDAKWKDVKVILSGHEVILLICLFLCRFFSNLN